MIKYIPTRKVNVKYSIRYRVARAIIKTGVNFDPIKNDAVRNMRDTITSLPTSNIQFIVSSESNGDWVAESVNLSGILTGGTKNDDVQEMIKDAIFTYFEIPAKYCEDSLLRTAGEPVIIKQEVFATA